MFQTLGTMPPIPTREACMDFQLRENFEILTESLENAAANIEVIIFNIVQYDIILFRINLKLQIFTRLYCHC